MQPFLTPLGISTPTNDGAGVPGETELFIPEGVCSKAIRYEISGGTVTRLDFSGGCDGNLKALSALVAGMKVEDVIAKLSGITCGNKPTSCADQLCKALRASLERQKAVRA
ncbi:Conserved hypothetical protein CHP03905 [Desulfovibrio sp. X2]|uniref:TIGR03905 family TSCPD domain-containing protein n=1 Tax=Desulfovibrio sp. X2 TaxID=941449 RepID=UPI00035889F8|nr:TIGR03905 family TSCPD domain-containing protein [Desulfovibrio sp. X2]EPR43471.1 Conserved hypothetical protein CHP03905 [Desulfovibrio sp. X2]